MNNPIETVPYSAKAVNELVDLERMHKGFRPNGEFQSGWCGDCFPTYVPCPTLIKARNEASIETRLAVALILG